MCYDSVLKDCGLLLWSFVILLCILFELRIPYLYVFHTEIFETAEKKSLFIVRWRLLFFSISLSAREVQLSLSSRGFNVSQKLDSLRKQSVDIILANTFI